MPSAIMTSPDFGEVMFLVAFLLFAIAFVVRLLAKPISIDFVLVAAGLAVLALGWLAL